MPESLAVYHTPLPTATVKRPYRLYVSETKTGPEEILLDGSYETILRALCSSASAHELIQAGYHFWRLAPAFVVDRRAR